ncbi:MAG TPA: outer membrane beta-barrel protein [Verrucomicrobiae bacterium]|nr:outer membrane beta-barrel protein [Verrucomicrobiae bacterium]
MKFNKWTVGLAAVGVVSLASAARADEQMSQVQTALSQTTLSGYVDAAAEWNPNTDQNAAVPYPGNTPKYSFHQNDGFTLNAVDIALDKPEDSSQWAAGYHVEMMYGSAAVGVPLSTVATAGLGAGATVTGSSIATIRQAFIRLHTPIGGNGIDWQVGVFDSIIGYESNSDPLNPNYSRSYGYTIEPTTFTGILGTYKVNDMISVSAGIANEEFVNSVTPANTFESQKAYLGSVSFTAPDSMGFLKGATLSGGVIHNVNSKTVTTYPGPTTSLYVGTTLPTPVTQLKVGGSFDYVFEDASTTTGGDLWDLAGYATFQATDKLSLNLRAEYFDDKTSPSAAALTFSGVALDYLYPQNNAEEVTATVQYNLWANVITRGEFRWDHVEHGDAFGVNSAGTANRSNDFLLALNVIYQF